MKETANRALLVVICLLLGCDTLSGTPTGAVCDESLELTWETFGQDFMHAYCVDCHSSYRTLAAVQDHGDIIDELSGAGPDALNRLMPESGSPQPTTEERELLATWLACGAP